MNNQRKLLYTLFSILISMLLLFCSREEKMELTNSFDLVLMQSVAIINEPDPLQHIMEGLIPVDRDSSLIGIDFRNQRLFRLSMTDGSTEFIAGKGSGPNELRSPVQVSRKNDSILYVYDIAHDQIARLNQGVITEKIPGFQRHHIWIRGTYGLYVDDHLITSIEEPDKIQNMSFDNSRPLAIMNLTDQTVRLAGIYSPTADRLDISEKYPFLALDKNRKHVYYIYSADYTIMRYDFERDETSVATDFKPILMRVRSRVSDPFDHSVVAMTRYGLDLSKVVGIEVVGDNLMVVWQNNTEAYYQNQRYSRADIQYFGVIYDLPDFKNPVEVSIPGNFLGVFGNKIIIENNQDPDSYMIDLYQLAMIPKNDLNRN